MTPHTLSTISLLIALAAAQSQTSPRPPSTTTTPPSSSTTPPTFPGQFEYYNVTVGENGSPTFNPNTLTAEPGDVVRFLIVGEGYTVTQGDFSRPCQFLNEESFHIHVNPDVEAGLGIEWEVQVNDTEPIWFYSADQCQEGMVGVINPPADQSQADFADVAENFEGESTEPANPDQGGFLGDSIEWPPVSEEESSTTTTAAMTTSVTPQTTTGDGAASGVTPIAVLGAAAGVAVAVVGFGWA